MELFITGVDIASYSRCLVGHRSSSIVCDPEINLGGSAWFDFNTIGATFRREWLSREALCVSETVNITSVTQSTRLDDTSFIYCHHPSYHE